MDRPSPDRTLASTHPDIAHEADGWDPTDYLPGSRAVMAWRCTACDMRWQTEIRNRVRGFQSCPSCHRHAHPPLTVTHPLIADELLPPYDPALFTHGSRERVWWRGPLGHVWAATVANRAKGSGCPVCSRGAGGRARRQPPQGLSLADVHPEIAREADGWDPRDYRVGSSARLPWQCSACGHRWITTVFRRTHRQGCPACAVDRRRSGYEGRLERHPAGQDHQEDGERALEHALGNPVVHG